MFSDDEIKQKQQQTVPKNTVKVEKKDSRYAKSQRAFKDTCKELKSEGLGFVKNFPEIEEKGKFFSQILLSNISNHS